MELDRAHLPMSHGCGEEARGGGGESGCGLLILVALAIMFFRGC